MALAELVDNLQLLHIGHALLCAERVGGVLKRRGEGVNLLLQECHLATGIVQHLAVGRALLDQGGKAGFLFARRLKLLAQGAELSLHIGQLGRQHLLAHAQLAGFQGELNGVDDTHLSAGRHHLALRYIERKDFACLLGRDDHLCGLKDARGVIFGFRSTTGEQLPQTGKENEGKENVANQSHHLMDLFFLNQV